MYKYTITFSASCLDEAGIRALLESQHDVSECSITRSKAKPLPPKKPKQPDNVRDFIPPPRWGATRSLVYAIFEDGHLHRLRDVRDALPAVQYAYLCRVVSALCKEGSLRKVEHGIYQATVAKPPSPREIAIQKEKPASASTGRDNQAILDFLESPRKPIELKARLGVSRQRVDQILKSLVKRKLVYRATHDGRSWTYCTDMMLLKEAVASRALEFGGAAAILLKVMPDRPILLEDIANHLDLNLSSIRRGIEELEGRGLAETKPFVGKVLLCLTEAGLASDERGAPDERATASDLLGTCGPQRTAILRILDVMGDLPTRHLRVALKGLYPEQNLTKSLGQIIQRYAKEDLIAVRNPDAAHPDRHLTDRGKALIDILRPALVPLTRQEIEAAASTAAAKESERRQAQVYSSRGHLLSERGHEILDILSNEGSLPRRAIYQKMKNPHGNYKSLDLALKTLQERGFVTRRAGSEKGELLWSISVLGRNILAEPIPSDVKSAHLP